MLANTIATDGGQRIQMSLWCMARSPLIIGDDVRNKTAQDLWYYTNPDLLLINNASTHNREVTSTKQGTTYVTSTWAAESTALPGVYYAALINVGGSSAEMGLSFAQLGINMTTCSVQDLWQHKAAGTASGSYTAAVPAGDVVVVSFSLCH